MSHVQNVRLQFVVLVVFALLVYEKNELDREKNLPQRGRSLPYVPTQVTVYYRGVSTFAGFFVRWCAATRVRDPPVRLRL